MNNLQENTESLYTELNLIFNSKFKIDDPFMIASSHWTSEENAFKKFEELFPSSLTLKTTSLKYGGDGQSFSTGRRFAELITNDKSDLGRFVDGPKNLELWDIASTYEMSDLARELFPKDEGTKIGLSILQGENYNEIAEALELKNYDYVELNWKYSFRKNIPNDFYNEILEDLKKFVSTFSDLQVIVKLPREITHQFFIELLIPVFEYLSDIDALLIVANSKRTMIPASKTSTLLQNINDLNTGVAIGEYLFIETYDIIYRLNALKKGGKKIPKIIASGGIMDISSFIDCIIAGADAVQLCTIFDKRGVFYLETLRQQLIKIIEKFKLLNYENLLNELKNEGKNTLNIIQFAKNLSYSPIIKDDNKNRNILRNTLIEQLKNESLNKSKTDEKIINKANSKVRLIVPKSNILSYLISEVCKYKFYRYRRLGRN